MNCRDIEKNLATFLENEIPEKKRNEIENHIKSCPSCSLLKKKFANLWAALGGRESIEPPPYFGTKVYRKIMEYDDRNISIWEWTKRKAGAARSAVSAIVIVICALAGYLLGDFPQESGSQSTYQFSQNANGMQGFLDSYNLSISGEFPAGSIEKTYMEAIENE